MILEELENHPWVEDADDTRKDWERELREGKTCILRYWEWVESKREYEDEG